MRSGPRAHQNPRLRPPAKYLAKPVFWRASRSAVLAHSLYTSSTVPCERFGLRTHPHVKILSKFEVLGRPPQHGRGATCQNASLEVPKLLHTDYTVAHCTLTLFWCSESPISDIYASPIKYAELSKSWLHRSILEAKPRTVAFILT